MFNLSSTNRHASHIAAIDLGSNSFHMIVAQWDNGQLNLLDRLREPVRMGFGLQEDGGLSDDARDRALACLERFGECLRAYPSRSVRIVGTKTLRSINDSRQFLIEAEKRLGHPVEIISGDEEARLIYIGVAHDIAPDGDNRIVMDIGGGSTEVIIGKGMQPILKESLNMGCIAITKKFFSEGKVTEKSVTKALIACLQELQPVKDEFLQSGWSQVLGASGSIKAVAKVCQANGWSDGTITLESLEKIISLYLQHGKLDAQIDGLSDDRKPVFLGGVIVLSALFDALELKQMVAAEWALREGLLFDQKGRLENHDIRQASVDALAARFHVNMEKAIAVEKTALGLLQQVAAGWHLTADDANKLLGWAARLYLVGLDIAHNDYHKHSAYIVQNVDLAGCSRAEQTQLAALVLAHRKRFPAKNFPLDNTNLVRLAILLRLAAICHRGRIKDGLPALKLKCDGKKITLHVPGKWIETHPLTQADLETEQRYLSDIDYELLLIAD
ncbi:Ppx/GppA phosphatase family protein [Cellvibrio sp. pealriver]|uniref:Ppx/GppA phosphatase family protein n=1 Tax=Cellvibrio sp. pealriver TaxID=1622269 RepID=UPI00066FC301|nr:Ppx/GppA phosphatase family protein [Cellvibrio sp. pealriver]